MMVALLLYGYCQGERSSRVIEKRCVRDVAYRVITGGLCPDHATITGFRAKHEAALGPGPGWRLRTRNTGTRGGPSRRPGTRLRRPGNRVATGRAMSRAPTGLVPSRGRTSPTRMCG